MQIVPDSKKVTYIGPVVKSQSGHNLAVAWKEVWVSQARWHQAITWTNVDLPLVIVKSSDIHLNKNS